jgi:hypothetical protein
MGLDLMAAGDASAGLSLFAALQLSKAGVRWIRLE